METLQVKELLGVFVPKGSYIQTSRNITVTCYCDAQKIDQSWIPAYLDITAYREANIANMDGHLVNEPGKAPAKGYIPGGSYQKTCRDIRVIMKAECQKIDQSWVYSSLDITDLATNKTLSNTDGVLKVD